MRTKKLKGISFDLTVDYFFMKIYVNIEMIYLSKVMVEQNTEFQTGSSFEHPELVWVSFGQKAKRPMTKGHSKLAITKKATPRRPILRKANLTGRPIKQEGQNTSYL